MHGPMLNNVWVSAHARNHVICCRYPKCLIAVVPPTSIYCTGFQKLSIAPHLSLRPFSATFVLRMRRNGYLWTSGVNLDTAVSFADPDLLLECKISAIWRCFPLIFAFYMPNVRHISTSGLFWPTDLESIPHALTPHVDNSHQVWSPYADPFLSYEWLRFPLVTVENAYAATAHTPNHATRE